MWKTLRYFWRRNLTVAGAVAITTAVLAGALLVGDSVRGSLRALTLDRLGSIRSVLLSDRFFHQHLVQEIGHPNAAAAVLLQGSASLNQARATNVQINGIDAAFLSLYDAKDLEPKLRTGGTFPPVIINQALAKELNAKLGDDVLLSFGKPSEIHQETILGNRDAENVVQRGRFTVTEIIPNEKIGRFSLTANQHLPLNAFVPLVRFQRLLLQPGEINALLVSGDQPPDFKRHLKLQDYGLKLVDYSSTFALESGEVILNPAVVEAALEAARALHLEALPILTYLANEIRYEDRFVPYSTITALPASAEFVDIQGQPVSPLREEEILLNEWAATDLNIPPGAQVELKYYVLGDGNRLLTKSSRFRLKTIIPQSGLAADPNLAPRYPGIEEAASMADWSPPFPVDLNIIRPRDEEYWNQHRATPKAFVSETTGKRIWSSRFGTYTSVRIPAKSRAVLGREILNRLNPAQLGFQLRDVREEGLRSSSGATDFGGLFIGFSLFLIVSAVLIVGLLFRLNVEQRKKEIGVLLATGMQLRKIQKQFLLEGGLLAVLGGIAGTGLALLYAWLMIGALESWWIQAIGSSFLALHIQWKSLVLGLTISIVICIVTILLSLRILSRWSVVALLKGSATATDEISFSRWSGRVAPAALIAAALLTFYAFKEESAALFFAGGAGFLIGFLAFFHHWLRSGTTSLSLRASLLATVQMAIRNAVRNSGRSLLSVSLVACACFVIIAVGANRRSTEKEWFKRESGTGGFGLVATSTVPIYEDLKAADFGLSAGKRMYGFRLRPGEDASCLNLYQPEKPRLLGVPQSLIHRGGFTFQESLTKTDNPWALLNSEQDQAIPAIGDYNSVRWILHKKVGDTITLVNDYGRPVQLRFVALLQSSLLQSELLISEENFLRHFPDHGGASYFLIETDPNQRQDVLKALESELDVYGFDAARSEEKLAAYHAVENTYLSTFQTLGALGLLLGTLGLAIILIRNVIERRGELATLRAFGFRRRNLGWFVLLENAFLLLIGIATGSASATVSILPHLLAQNPQVPWSSLGITLVIVFAVGMMGSIAALTSTLRIPLLPALKSESS